MNEQQQIIGDSRLIGGKDKSATDLTSHMMFVFRNMTRGPLLLPE